MVGGTLRDIRAEIRSLARPDGDYAVVCGRTGDEPAPVSGLRFEDRYDAGEAAELATEYRATMRRYDPAVPFYDPVVHEVAQGPAGPFAGAPEGRRTRYVSFCHDVTGAVFEALSETGHRGVESATMETYLTLAEVVADRDQFCLTLLWSMLSEMDVRLSTAAQQSVVETAAETFASAPTPNPAGSTLDHLQSAAFLDDYSLRPVTPAADADRGWQLTFGDYALAERTGRLPTLPLAVDVLRRIPDRSVRFAGGEALSDARWRLRLETGVGGESTGLVSVDADENRWLDDPNADAGR